MYTSQPFQLYVMRLTYFVYTATMCCLVADQSKLSSLTILDAGTCSAMLPIQDVSGRMSGNSQLHCWSYCHMCVTQATAEEHS